MIGAAANAVRSDKCNDQRQGSYLWENRRKYVKELLGEVRLENDTLHILLILQLICNFYFFLDKGIIGCPADPIRWDLLCF